MGEMVPIGEEATKIMVADGVGAGFGVTAYHTEPLYGMLPRYGVPTYLFRHEQSGPYAADGYSGACRKIGVCWGTAGPGVTNMVSGVAQAYQNMRPMLVLAGMHGANVDKHWGLQEVYPVPIMQSICKMVWQVNDYRSIPAWTRKLIRIAKDYPPGPTVLASTSAMTGDVVDRDTFLYYEPRERVAFPSRTSGDPKVVAEAVEMLLKAERPFILAGDGAYWSEGEQELKEFVELTQIPVCLRRTSRGMIPEDQILSIGPGWRGPMQGQADVVLLLGLREGITEGMMLPPILGPYRRDCTYIQINEASSEMVDFLPTAFQVMGSCKLVLKQMIDCAKDLLKDRKPDRSTWLEEARKGREKHWAEVKAKAEAEKDKRNPIGAWFWGKELGEFVTSIGRCAVILDSFTGSWVGSDKYVANEAGLSQDTGGWSGVGNSIAQGFGIQVAKPGTPVCCIIGDGGMGIGAMELETCARYGMPVVAVVFNNNEWIGGGWELLYSSGIGVSNRVTVDQRYDQMFEPVGCHGEWVTQPEQLRPALERAFNSGKPAVVNCKVDPWCMHPWVPQNLLAGYLKWFGIERCKEMKVYDDAFWKNVAEPFDGGPLGKGAEGLRNMLAWLSPIMGF